MTILSCVYSSFLQQTNDIHRGLILALDFLCEVVCVCIKNLSWDVLMSPLVSWVLAPVTHGKKDSWQKKN